MKFRGLHFLISEPKLSKKDSFDQLRNQSRTQKSFSIRFSPGIRNSRPHFSNFGLKVGQKSLFSPISEPRIDFKSLFRSTLEPKLEKRGLVFSVSIPKSKIHGLVFWIPGPKT